MSVTRRGFLSLGAAVAAGSALTGCGVLDRSSATATENKVMNSDPIRVGATLELSGGSAASGRLQERAIAIALAELNVDGVRVGDSYRKLEVVTRDNQGNGATATDIAEEFAGMGVAAIIGGLSPEAAFATLKVAEAKHVPYLSFCGADAISIPLSTRKFTYKLAPNASDVATRLARRIRAAGQKDVVVLSTDDTLAGDGVRATKAALAAANRDLVDTVELPASGKDFAGAAARAVEKKPDAVIVWTSPANAVRVVQALRDTDENPAIYLPPTAIDDDTLKDDNASVMEGVFVLYSPVLAGAPFIVNTASGRETRLFVNRYNQEYGAFSGCMPYAADALALVAAAARRVSTVEGRRLRGALESTPYDGVAGAYGFSPIDHGGMAPEVLAIFQAKGQGWQRL
ncbi:MAG: ABC transporter substrate-binding protein [Hamadaea sp.]|uniref:ABC transporter substrate-binding protein n=1 Tax=Hamadaea sp. TaxID=2024425 RepID=UPI0017AF29C3|nr:ABC transporter substrate-binding protein [Hamadaea sp.]NUR74037.1 ABC transporter substrate-binding protein [Hamadaea sp.]NUT23265.1 ABC transporter substrate-binding protein [Hamadaea sp.]